MSLLDPQLTAFLTVVKHTTVHGASAEMHITQTGFAQRIRTLGKRFATSLFVRPKARYAVNP
jgi:DNA-binding transcriptional LysR family regulator